MLYLEDQDDAAWVELARLLASREPLEMVLCLHPGQAEEDLDDPFVPAGASRRIERVIRREDGDPPCSSPVVVDDGLLGMLERELGEFEEWGETLALYRPRTWEWLACLIPHERIVMVRDDALLPLLRFEGLSATDEAPDWWQEDEWADPVEDDEAP